MVREALSARRDGEALPPGLDETSLESHLASCVGCRSWLAQIEAMATEWRFGPVPEVSDVTTRILDSIGAGRVGAGRRPRRVAVRAALVLVGLVELAAVAPVLVFGHDREAPLHVAHEMGSFGMAIAAGLLAAALKPYLARGMAWLVSAAAASLVVTAVVDLATGVTTWSDESPHLLVVAGAILLWALARIEPGGGVTLTGTEPAGDGPIPTGLPPLRLVNRVRRGSEPDWAVRKRAS